MVDIDTFYGQLAALDEVVESVFKDMQTYVPEAPSLSKLKVDTLCAVLMDEEWHRARILTLSPAITAQLVDLGDIIVVKEDQLREIPAILQSERIHCFKFKISNASKEHAKLKISDIVRIKPEMFCPESDSWIVVVEDNHRAQVNSLRIYFCSSDARPFCTYFPFSWELSLDCLSGVNALITRTIDSN